MPRVFLTSIALFGVIALRVRGSVPGMSAEDFQAAAEDAKVNCPVSQALKAVPITLDAALA